MAVSYGGTVFELGKYFTAAVTVSADQPVIAGGPYRWIRHPGCTAGFVVFLGIGLTLGNWLSLIIFFLEIYYVYGRRVEAEERALLDTIGEPTARLRSSAEARSKPSPKSACMARTKRFIPFIF